MGWNDAYWNGKQQRAQKAKAHHEMMLSKYPEEIKHSIQGTVVWDDQKVSLEKTEVSGITEATVQNTDTVTGLFQNQHGNTVVLNFASYKNPGGGFLAGSGAQEEALCHESTLYEVLSSTSFAAYYAWNNDHKNKALYTNRALWSPDIIFEHNGQTTKADVLTVAAPNRKAYMDYIHGANETENLETLKSRIAFISELIEIHHVDTAILGAFGCGVFAQDPSIVASLFKDAFENTGIHTVYAVIDKGGHSKEGAYTIFSQAFSLSNDLCR